MSLVISTLSKTSRILIFSLFLTVSLTRVIAEDNSAKLNELWDNITSEGNILLKNSLKSFSEIIDEVSQTIDQELLALSQAIKGQSKVDTLDKIDSIKIHIEDLTELKKKESTAPKFAIISKSKKDYVIKIDKVLKEIEPIFNDDYESSGEGFGDGEDRDWDFNTEGAGLKDAMSTKIGY